jgi:hypothetical protein
MAGEEDLLSAGSGIGLRSRIRLWSRSRIGIRLWSWSGIGIRLWSWSGIRIGLWSWSGIRIGLRSWSGIRVGLWSWIGIRSRRRIFFGSFLFGFVGRLLAFAADKPEGDEERC